MAGRKEQHAYRLGSRDAYAGKRALDVHDDSGLVLGIGGSAELMTELGETSATTSRNWDARQRMCDAYLDGYHAAVSAMSGGARSETIDCDACGVATDHGMAWGNAMLCPGCFDRHNRRPVTP